MARSLAYMTPGSVSSAFTPSGSLYDGNSSTEAVWTDATRRGTSTTNFGNLQKTQIPTDAVNCTVTAVLVHRESTALASLTVAGTDVPLSATTRTDRVVVDSGASYAALPTSVQVVHTRANNTTSTTCYVGEITIEVAFDLAEPPTAEISPSEAWVSVGQFTTVTVTATGVPAPSLVWSYDGGALDVDSTASMKVLSWSTPGRKRVACTVSNVAGQVVVESFVNVNESRPPISGLVDSFDTDTGLWPGTYGNVVRANGEVSITAEAGYPALWTSPNQYSLVGGSVYAEMVIDTPPAGANEFLFELREDSQNLVSFYVSGIEFAIITRKAGVLAEHLRGAYSSETMRFIRYSADLPGQIIVWISADGAQFNQLWAFTPETCPISGEIVEVLFTAGQWETGPGTLRILGVNSMQPLPGTALGEVWNGTRWVAPEVWNGTRWVPGSEVEVFNGTAWVPMGGVSP